MLVAAAVDLPQLDAVLGSEGVNSSVITSINSYLIGLGDTKGLSDTRHLISVQSGTPPFVVAELLNVSPAGIYSIATVPGDQLIVVPSGNSSVTITDHTRVMVTSGDGSKQHRHFAQRQW